MTETTTDSKTPFDLAAIKARNDHMKACYGDDWKKGASESSKDRDALITEVDRLRARWESSQRGVGELLDRSENAEFRLEKTTADLATVNAALDRLLGAAEDVLAGAEQAETNAVFSGVADPARLGTPALKALREAILALPTGDEQDKAVTL